MMKAEFKKAGCPTQFDETCWDKYVLAITNWPPCPVCNGPQGRPEDLGAGKGCVCLEDPRHYFVARMAWLRMAIEGGTFAENIEVVLGPTCEHGKRLFYCVGPDGCLVKTYLKLVERLETVYEQSQA